MKDKLKEVLKNHNILRPEVRKLMEYAKEQLKSSLWTPGFDFSIEEEILRFDIFMKGSRMWYEICNKDGIALYKNSWSLGQEDEEPLDEIIRYYLILREKELISFAEKIEE